MSGLTDGQWDAIEMLVHGKSTLPAEIVHKNTVDSLVKRGLIRRSEIAHCVLVDGDVARGCTGHEEDYQVEYELTESCRTLLSAEAS